MYTLIEADALSGVTVPINKPALELIRKKYKIADVSRSANPRRPVPRLPLDWIGLTLGVCDTSANSTVCWRCTCS